MHGYVQQAGRFRRVQIPIPANSQKKAPQTENPGGIFLLFLVALCIGIELLIWVIVSTYFPNDSNVQTISIVGSLCILMPLIIFGSVWLNGIVRGFPRGISSFGKDDSV